MTAGRKEVKLLNQYLSEGISFNQETTLCEKAILKNIRKAKERVKVRVSEGGHGIPEEYIERRYVETFKNLKEVLKYCDLAAFYDNTVQFHRFAIFRNGEITRISNTLPIWFKEKEFV